MSEDRLIVAALLRKEGQILLVVEHTAGDHQPVWVLPAGTAEPDELLLECLQRVVREETGLEVVGVGELISLAQSHRPATVGLSTRGSDQLGKRVTVFAFEVTEWKGDLHPIDPDGSMEKARFWPRNEAMVQLERGSIRALSEPILAYLHGERADRAWFYRLDVEGREALEWPTREPTPEVSEQIRRARAIVVLGCIAILAILVIIVIIGIITLARPFV